MAAWRNGNASDYELSCYQEIAGSTPAVVNVFSADLTCHAFMSDLINVWTNPRCIRQRFSCVTTVLRNCAGILLLIILNCLTTSVDPEIY